MRSNVVGILVIVVGVIGLGLLFNLAVVDIPVHFQFLHADYPDPDRPGHLKGVIVDTPEFFLHLALTLGSFGLAYSLWRTLPRRGTSQ